MIKDYITLAKIKPFRKYLIREGHAHEPTEENAGFIPYLPLFCTPNYHFEDKKKEVTYALVRCMDVQEEMTLNDCVSSGHLEIVGEAVGGKYYFNNDFEKERYERLREVGDYRKQVVKLDEEGKPVLDEKGNPILVKTTHPYMFGLFA